MPGQNGFQLSDNVNNAYDIAYCIAICLVESSNGNPHC